MSTPGNDPLDGFQSTRRKLLFSGLAVSFLSASGLSFPKLAFANSSLSFIPFMQISRLLVNHQLDELVGQKMLLTLETQHADLATSLNQLLAIAQEHNARIVEDFFPAIPEGALQDLAYKIIFGWYTGSFAPVRDAETFAFEKALTWQTTIDVTTIPSYGISGPNNWQRINTPVLPVPTF